MEVLEKIQNQLYANQISMNKSLENKIINVLAENLTEDGTKVFGKSINSEPEKYFTDEVLTKIDEYTKQKFTYGKDEE